MSKQEQEKNVKQDISDGAEAKTLSDEELDTVAGGNVIIANSPVGEVCDRIIRILPSPR